VPQIRPKHECPSAPSARSGRVGVAGAGVAFSPTAWPTIAVTCLAFESRIAAGPGVAVLHGHIPNLRTALEESDELGRPRQLLIGLLEALLATAAFAAASAFSKLPVDS